MSKIEIKRTAENDEICRETCKGCDGLHSSFCPYTQARWKQQGWSTFGQFAVSTPKEIREAKAA